MITTLAASIPWEYLETLRNSLRLRAYRRLTQALQTARSVLFDNTSRLVFFSDLHRGDNSRSDAFTRNEDLFLHALDHYYREGFTYVEVGDGDELWQNRKIGAVKQAHRRTFDLLHTFERQNRLHVIFGNHDIQGHPGRQVKKDGLTAYEGLTFQHADTGQQIFVVHGHQVDFKSDYLHRVARFLTRHIWKRVQNLGIADGPSHVGESRNRMTIRQRVTEWIQAHRQIVICGHTHTPAFPALGAPPYFNTGSCIFADFITGLEISDGMIALVKWARQESSPRFERYLMTPPRPLHLVAAMA